ncbi:MAG: HAD-IA family hydrolase [Acidimicrobiales bacterium]
MPNPTTPDSSAGPFRAVLFDFGGVILTSPFEAFETYEADNGLPDGLIRTINSTNPDDNAWAKFERNDVDVAGFAELFEAEAAERGHTVDGRKILELIHGDIRPEMVEGLNRVKAAGFRTACLTNNFRSWQESPDDVREVIGLFDHVIESSVVGVRKPEVRFYEIALETVGVEAADAVFLDDLGINLKPAKAMGMTTIKVTSGPQALADLGAVIGLELA